MPTVKFNRDAMAQWYARQHLGTDPGIREVYHLPKDAPDREIRLVEINELLAEMNDNSLEPVDFGVDTGAESEHRLLVLDVTPSQWEAIKQGTLPLPTGWTLKDSLPIKNRRR